VKKIKIPQKEKNEPANEGKGKVISGKMKITFRKFVS